VDERGLGRECLRGDQDAWRSPVDTHWPYLARVIAAMKARSTVAESSLLAAIQSALPQVY